MDSDPLAPLVTAASATVGLLLAAIGLWLLLALLLTVAVRAAALGTRTRGVADALLRRLAPAAVRRGLALAVGVALSLGACPADAATSLTADPSVTAPSSPATPTREDPDVVLQLDWPAAASPAAAQGARVAETGTGVTVRAGDSLWRIADRALRSGGAPRAVTARQVATHWPLWWQANRAVIGDDPDLIHPGARLTAPPD